MKGTNQNLELAISRIRTNQKELRRVFAELMFATNFELDEEEGYAFLVIEEKLNLIVGSMVQKLFDPLPLIDIKGEDSDKPSSPGGM